MIGTVEFLFLDILPKLNSYYILQIIAEEQSTLNESIRILKIEIRKVIILINKDNSFR